MSFFAWVAIIEFLIFIIYRFIKKSEINSLNTSLSSKTKECEKYKTNYEEIKNLYINHNSLVEARKEIKKLLEELNESIEKLTTIQYDTVSKIHVSEFENKCITANIEYTRQAINIIAENIELNFINNSKFNDSIGKITHSEIFRLRSNILSSKNLLDELLQCLKRIEYEKNVILKIKAQEEKNASNLIKLQNDRRIEIFERISKFRRNNTFLIPYISKIIADAETADFEYLAKLLDWGNNKERSKKVDSIRELRKEAQRRIEQHKWSEYQLNYLLALFPQLQDVIETEYKDLKLSFNDVTQSEIDPIKEYLTRDEWDALTTSEKNQLALDRYIQSHKKSKWQIGRDYELYIGHLYEQEGYSINYYGSYMGLEDLGRDLIASKKDCDTVIIQCKYWSKEKEIHEKHIMQLYGSLIAYIIENKQKAKGLLITNTKLSYKAKEFAKLLEIDYIENKELQDFPRIKCNINYTDDGISKIYHLPMDFQYDKTKIENKGEFMAMTVEEAEKAGFRRAYKWHGL